MYMNCKSFPDPDYKRKVEILAKKRGVDGSFEIKKERAPDQIIEVRIKMEGNE